MKLNGRCRWALDDMETALSWAEGRNSLGIRCVLDVLGESARAEIEADKNATHILALIDSICKRRLEASVAIKPSALGSRFDMAAANERAQRLAEHAATKRVSIEIDMELRSEVDTTLALAERLAPIANTTVAVQSYLKRSKSDIERLVSKSIRIRLVKGAYAGDLSDYEEIRRTTMRICQDLIERDVDFCIGTHDPYIIGSLVEGEPIPNVEFGFLKGLAGETKLSLAEKGWSISEYLPFGTNRKEYEMRRQVYLNRMEELRVPLLP
jgi:proline dehydrogenase